jgi:bifunctional DNA-binding transcriptional regulator/antitoxin component of YhaV-PrlF toxin-antitoxin module
MKMMERGQITIPRKYREKYGITKSTELEFVPTDEGLLLVKKTSGHSPLRQVYGILKKNTSTDAYIDRIRGRA